MALSKFGRVKRKLATGAAAQQPAWRNPDPKSRYEAIIIGGGGHGLATAYYLAKVHRMRHTVVLERGWLGETCWQLPVVYGRGADIPESVALHQSATAKYAELATELGYVAGTAQRGVIEVAESDRDTAALTYAADLHRLSGGSCQTLDRDELAAKLPLLGSPASTDEGPVGGVLYPDGGLGHPEQLIWAYARAAEALGVDVVQECEVTGFIMDGRKVAGVETSRGRIEAPIVAIAAEGYASDVAAVAGFPLPIQTRSIEVVATEPFAPILDPVVVSRSTGTTAAQMASGEIIASGGIGAYVSTSPWGSGSRAERLLVDLVRLLPRLGGAQVTQRWSAPVDVTPDRQPIIGRAPIDGMFLNCGWGAQGYAALPASSTLFAELLGRFTVSDLIAPFSPARFSTGSRTPGPHDSGGYVGGWRAMLLIPCPWCGPRPENEFSGGTDSGRTRPEIGETSDSAWTGYLFSDANVAEDRQERWCHTHGCGQWFLLERDAETGALGKASRVAPPPSPKVASDAAPETMEPAPAPTGADS